MGTLQTLLAAIETNTKELNALLEQTDPNIKSRAFDSSKITAHHAIIPTETTADFSTLKEDERRIYMLIAKAYCLQFLSNYEYDRQISFLKWKDDSSLAGQRL